MIHILLVQERKQKSVWGLILSCLCFPPEISSEKSWRLIRCTEFFLQLGQGKMFALCIILIQWPSGSDDCHVALNSAIQGQAGWDSEWSGLVGVVSAYSREVGSGWPLKVPPNSNNSDSLRQWSLFLLPHSPKHDMQFQLLTLVPISSTARFR